MRIKNFRKRVVKKRQKAKTKFKGKKKKKFLKINRMELTRSKQI